MLGTKEGNAFFNQLKNQIQEQDKEKRDTRDTRAIKEIIKRETKIDNDILDYCKEYNLDIKTATEIRDTKMILDEADRLDINNPFECVLYNQMMQGLDGAY